MRRTSAARRGPVLLVGDAAGLVDPLSGDGIYEAFVSARLAAAAILEGRLDDYETTSSRAALGRYAETSLEGEARARPSSPRRVRDRAPPSGVARDRRTRSRGDLTHPSDAHGFARPPLRLLARL